MITLIVTHIFNLLVKLIERDIGWMMNYETYILLLKAHKYNWTRIFKSDKSHEWNTCHIKFVLYIKSISRGIR